MAPRASRRSSSILALALLGGIVGFAAFTLNQEHSRSTDHRTFTSSLGTQFASEIQLLQRIQQAYRKLDAYADSAVFRLRWGESSAQPADESRMWSRYRRPDRLSLRILHGPREFQLEVADGQSLAMVKDPVVEDFRGQIVRQRMPSTFNLADVHRAVEMVDPRQPQVRASILDTLPVPLTISQLALLLDDQACETLLRTAQSLEELSPTTLRGQTVRRLCVESPSGEFIFWIDPQSFLLHRIEYEPKTDGANTQAQIRMTVDVEQIETQPQLADEAIPSSLASSSAHYRWFVLPPEERPSPLLGQVVRGLHFVDLWGQPLGDQVWDSRIAVFLWFQRDRPGQAGLQELAEVHAHFAKAAGPTESAPYILAISVEPATEVSHAEVSQWARPWRGSAPLARDLHACGRDVLHIERAPTIVVLDALGRLQLKEEGGDSHLSDELIRVVERLQAGEDLAGKYREQLEDQWRAYENALREALVVP